MAQKYLFVILLTMNACAPSVATQGELDKKMQQGASAQKASGADVALVLGVKKEAPPPPPILGTEEVPGGHGP